MKIDETTNSELAPVLPPENNGSTQPAGNGNPPVVAPNPALERASSAAVDEHLSETAPKKRGPKSRSVRLYPAAGASAPAQIKANGGNGAPEATEEVPVEFNEEDAKAYADMLLDFLSDIKVTAIRFVAKQNGRSDEFLKQITEDNFGIGKKQRENLQRAAVGVARKHAKKMLYAPETALAIGLVGTIASTVSQCKTVAAKPNP